MKLHKIAWILVVGAALFAGSALAYDCSGLPQWKRQAYYPVGAQVQYQEVAYKNTGEPSKRDFPDAGYPWSSLGECASTGGGGGGGGSGELQPISIYGAWHCGNDYCTWASPRDTRENGEFDIANRWLIDRGDGEPSVNLVVLSFVHPLKLLRKTTDEQTLNGVPRGMTPEFLIVDFRAKAWRGDLRIAVLIVAIEDLSVKLL